MYCLIPSQPAMAEKRGGGTFSDNSAGSLGVELVAADLPHPPILRFFSRPSTVARFTLLLMGSLPTKQETHVRYCSGEPGKVLGSL